MSAISHEHDQFIIVANESGHGIERKCPHFKMNTEIFGWIGVVTTCIVLLPQVYVAVKTRSAGGLTPLTLIIYVIADIAWTIYGAGKDSMSLIIASLVQLAAVLVILGCALWDDDLPNDVFEFGVRMGSVIFRVKI